MHPELLHAHAGVRGHGSIPRIADVADEVLGPHGDLFVEVADARTGDDHRALALPHRGVGFVPGDQGHREHGSPGVRRDHARRQRRGGTGVHAIGVGVDGCGQRAQHPLLDRRGTSVVGLDLGTVVGLPVVHVQRGSRTPVCAGEVVKGDLAGSGIHNLPLGQRIGCRLIDRLGSHLQVAPEFVAVAATGKDLAVDVGEDVDVFLPKDRVGPHLLCGDRRRRLADLEDGSGRRGGIRVRELGLLGADHEHLACGVDILDEKRLGGTDELVAVFSGGDRGDEEGAAECKRSDCCGGTPTDASIDGHERRVLSGDGTGRYRRGSNLTASGDRSYR